MSAWTPVQLSPEYWFDASDVSTMTFTGSWLDQFRSKGTVANKYAWSDGVSPTVSSVNGLPSLQSTGSAVMQSNITPGELTGPLTVFAVLDPNPALPANLGNICHPFFTATNWPEAGLYWELQTFGTEIASFYLGSHASNQAATKHISGVVNANNHQFNLNSFFVSYPNALSGNSNLTLFTGVGSNRRYLGQFCELIIIKTILGQDDRDRLIGWAHHKWGMQNRLADSHPYKNSPPRELWTPTKIPTTLWFDASDRRTLWNAESGGSNSSSDGFVRRWADKSGNNRHLLSPSNTNAPTRHLNVQNGLDVVRFGGTDDFMLRSGAISTNTSGSVVRTIYVQSLRSASQLTGGGDYWRLISNSNGTGFDDFNTGMIELGAIDGNGNPLAYSCDTRRSSSSSLIWHDFTLGRNARQTGTPQYNHGDCCEVVCVENETNDIRFLIEGYLAWKWGTQSLLPSNHPYKNAAPTIGNTRRRRYAGAYGL